MKFRSLLIETSTERGMIGCFDEDEPIFLEPLPFGSAQSRFLMPILAEKMKSHGIEGPTLSCIGVGIGPGSYTGIRIGVAVAQALAYGWDLPLIGISSLEGFIPDIHGISFASIIDARIGGAYLRKGKLDSTGEVQFFTQPEMLPLEKLATYLTGIKHLVTPSSALIQAKLNELYPDNSWIWVEKAPSGRHLGAQIKLAYAQGLGKKGGHLELLYLRETEAEQEKIKKKKINRL
ncbi:MAG: tRNA (adenosine(37)-N6)-threonylcarbamoyltransferase complex dimerization subunit type 1 TsaB [Candidatus Protochlamydia sp.]|nr:tRNA (adenosine(37)-N6)-threonylcarbamoyltransferase complex dimerization subunit type 1 TsaB [Candidatus Protochlamydia sp.]